MMPSSPAWAAWLAAWACRECKQWKNGPSGPRDRDFLLVWGFSPRGRMSRFAEPMVRLIDELKKLPGVGGKTAQRLAFHILRTNDEDAEALAAAVRDVKANLRLCSICNNITDVDPCVYCSS